MKPFQAIDHIKTQEDLDAYVAEHVGELRNKLVSEKERASSWFDECARQAGKAMRFYQALEEISELGDVRADEAPFIAKTALAYLDDLRRCQKCGTPTNGEEALVDGECWCHPCADGETK